MDHNSLALHVVPNPPVRRLVSFQSQFVVGWHFVVVLLILRLLTAISTSRRPLPLKRSNLIETRLNRCACLIPTSAITATAARRSFEKASGHFGRRSSLQSLFRHLRRWSRADGYHINYRSFWNNIVKLQLMEIGKNTGQQHGQKRDDASTANTLP